MGCLDEDRLLGLVRGELAPAEVSAVDAHLDGCTDCRELLAHVAKTSLVRARPPTAEDSLPSSTVAREAARAGARAADRTGPLSRGMLIDRYVVLRTLGAGGMGVVYAAYDPELDRKVAVKLLRLGAVGEAQLDDARQRLLREAQAMARVDHPNVIAVHDVGTFEGQIFVAMEYVDGGTLTQWLRSAPRSWTEALTVLLAAGRGLAAAHAADLVHRDFKPDNVLLGRDGRVLVSDFGLARSARADLVVPPSENADLMPRRGETLTETLTQTGAAVGTPAYMAPEQHRGRLADAKSDQWSYCVTLFEAVYGRRPFVADRLDVLVARIAEGAIDEPPAVRGVPGFLRRALLRGLSVDPAARFESMAALLDELSPERRGARRRRTVAAVGAIGLLATLVGLGRAGTQAPPACVAPADRVSAAWGPARKSAVHAAFTATRAPFAEDAWRATSRTLDDYAAAWSAMRLDACQATRVRGEQSEAMLDLRMRCLDRRLADLSALTDVFARADADIVRGAGHAASALPALARCADGETLATLVPLPPDDGRVEALALEDELAEVQALARAGDYPGALPHALSVADGARALGYRPLEAEALLSLAQVEEVVDDLAAAEADMTQAVLAGVAGRHDAVVAEALSSLVHVSYRRGRFDDGLAWARWARAAVERLPDPQGLAEALDVHEALVLTEQGRYDEADARYLRATAGYEARGPVAADELSLALDAHALLRMDRGDLPAARALHERAQALREERLGPSHPDIAASHEHLAAVAWGEGRYDDALERFRRAGAIYEAAFGVASLQRAQIEANEGVVLLDAEQPADALEHLVHALPVLEAAVGAAHPDVARLHFNVGSALRRLGRSRDARRELTGALATWEAAVGPEHIDVAMCLFEIAELERGEGRFDDARVAYERSLRIVETAMGPDFRGAGYVLVGMAQLDLARRAPDRAVAKLERAESLQAGDRIDPLRLADTRMLFARALHEAKRDPDRARSLASAARGAAELGGERGKKRLAAIDALLQIL